MNLIVDIGNTFIKATFFNNSKIEKKYSFEKSKTKKLYELLDASNIEKIFISNVGSQIDTLELSKYKKVLHFKQNLKITLKLNYRDKNKLGKDRIAAMVGARKLFPEKNLLVIDIGTCITMDVLTYDGIFLVTTEPAPMKAYLPNLIPQTIVELAPIVTPSSIFVFSSHPNSVLIKEESKEYLKSCPGLSSTNTIFEL